jgi:hypothetical protein
MKKHNYDAFAIMMNIHFLSDVQHTWGQCKDKFNKMKEKYNVEKKKINFTCAPQPWYERFDYLFVGIVIILTLGSQLNVKCKGP